MGKLSNLLNMIEYLNTGRKYSIEELSSLLEVSPRMVRFYKEEMEKAGIYVDTIHGPYGGYVLKRPVLLPDRSLSEGDLHVLEEFSNTLKGKEQEEMLLLLDKLRGSLFTSRETIPLPDKDLPIYNEFSKAIKEKRKVEIHYLSKGKPENIRIIHPYHIFRLEEGWAVAAYCERKEDLRHFEFSRITKVHLLEEFYEINDTDQILPH